MLLLFPLYFAFTTLSDLVPDDKEIFSVNDPFVYSLSELEDQEPVELRFLRQLLSYPRHQGSPNYQAFVQASERFPDVLSCVQSDPHSQYVDLTQFRRGEMTETQDMEVCIWRVGHVVGGPDRMVEWLRAFGFESVRSYERRYQSFDEAGMLTMQQGHQITASWRSKYTRTGQPLPFSRLTRLRYWMVGNMSLGVLYADQGHMLEVRIGMSFW